MIAQMISEGLLEKLDYSNIPPARTWRPQTSCSPRRAPHSAGRGCCRAWRGYQIMAAPADVLERCEVYENLPAGTLALYSELWVELGIE